MYGHFNTEIGRMRAQESVARADRYRLAQRSARRAEPLREQGSKHRVLVWRKALQAVALSIVVTVFAASAALARPADAGPAAGSGSPVTAPGVETPLQSAPTHFGMEIVGLVAFAALVITVALALVRRRAAAPAS